MNKELLEVIDNMIERLALIELYTGKNEGTLINKSTLLDIQRELKSQEKTDKEIAFDLIDTKNVDIKLLKWAYPSVEAYNVKVRTEKDYWWREELAKEEFEFIGRLVGAK